MSRKKNRNKRIADDVNQTPAQKEISEFLTGRSTTGGNKGNSYDLAKPACSHSARKPLWVLPKGGAVYAGAKHQLRSDEFDAILDCTGSPTAPPGGYPVTVQGLQSEKYAHLLNLGRPPATRININWPDGGVPPVQPEFWRVLARDVEGDVAICCVGSHGRTGTALAALYMGQYALMDKDDPTVTLSAIVKFIREAHCENAVETASQVTYLMGLATYFEIPHGAAIVGSYSIQYATKSTVSPVVRVTGNITYKDNTPPIQYSSGADKKYDYEGWSLSEKESK